MHPRSTRNRPLLLMGRKEVYTNNIKSPSRCSNLFVQDLLNDHRLHSCFTCDAASCYKVKDSTVSCNGIYLDQFVIEFWNEESTDICPLLRVVIHAPSRWSPDHFLQILEKVIYNYNVLSLIFSYYMNGYKFSYVTINNLHHHYHS